MPYGFNDNKTKYELPTKLSQFTNDSGFITNTVNNLTNYYNKQYIDASINIQSKSINVNTNIVGDGKGSPRTPKIFLVKSGKVFQYAAYLRIKSSVTPSNYYTIASNINISDIPYQVDVPHPAHIFISGDYHPCFISFVSGTGYSIELHIINELKQQSPGAFLIFNFTAIGNA